MSNENFYYNFIIKFVNNIFINFNIFKLINVFDYLFIFHFI